MIESNPVNLKQGIGVPGSSKKLQTCLRATHRQEGKAGLPVRRTQTGKEPQQMMPFACVMGNACCSTTQKTGKIPLNFRPDKAQGSGIRDRGSGIRGQGSKMVDAPGLLKFNLKNAVAVKGKGIAESSHGAVMKGEEAKGLKLSMHMHASNGSEETKDINHFMDASKGKDGVGGRTSAVYAKLRRAKEVGGQRSKMVDAPGLLKFKLKNATVVKGKSAVEPVRTEKNTEKNSFTLIKSGGKNNIGNSLKHLGLKGGDRAVVGKNEAQVSVGPPEPFGGLIGTFGKRVPSGIGNGKNRDGGLKKNVAGKNSRATEDGSGLLKSSLKNAVVVKGKSIVEPAGTEKNSFTLVKSGGKNNIGNSLKPLGLNGEEIIKIPHRGTLQPERLSDKGFSAVGYNNTTFHATGSSTAVNESVNSSGIEPRTLINQIANSVKIPGRVRITLNPPSLGTLDVDVLVRDNKVHVILQVENNDVRHILQSNVESLKTSLRNHGLVADAINVLVQEKSDGADYGANYKSGQNETLFKEDGNREGNEEDHGGGQDSVNHDPTLLEEENPRVRNGGRISLFA